MKWLQNTWVKRVNARHGLCGHVFGGRYAAVLVEQGDYLGTLLDYVHLNPVRTGLVKPGEGLDNYQWSSLVNYTLPPRGQTLFTRAINRNALGRLRGPDRYPEPAENSSGRNWIRPP